MGIRSSRWFNKSPDRDARVRVATWNTKQDGSPRKTAREQWEWLEATVAPDIVVLTEAKPPDGGFPGGWTAIWEPEGLGPRRRWGTIVAARGLVVSHTQYRRRSTRSSATRPNPGASFAVDVNDGDRLLLRVFAHYGVAPDDANGAQSLAGAMREFNDLTRIHGLNRTVFAGDFNLWPNDVEPVFREWRMSSSTSLRSSLPALENPVGGTRVWTHKKGRKTSEGVREELDYIFVSRDLSRRVVDSWGGIDDFPNSWEMSDHAPVVVDIAR